MSADDSFIVQFRLTSGCVGVMQRTCADRSLQMIETRVAGTEGSVWIAGLGSEVCLADVAGVRVLAVDPDFESAEGTPPPESTFETDHERMIELGLEVPAYTRLAKCFHALITGQPSAPQSEPARFSDGAAALRVLEAACRSAAERLLNRRRRDILKRISPRGGFAMKEKRNPELNAE